MISLIDALVLNIHIGNDVDKVIKDYQIVNDCSEEDAIEALVDKYVESTIAVSGGGE